MLRVGSLDISGTGVMLYLACLVFHIYRRVARLVYRLSNQRLIRQPAICSLLFGRIAMPSQSPQSSPSQPSSRSKKSPKTSDNDANIHNFAPVARIMKTALPENAKIAKEAKECMQECVSEFISFITSEGMFSPCRVNVAAVRLSACANVCHSIRKVSARETQNGQWRRHPFRHDFSRL